MDGMKNIKHLIILMMENRSFDHFLGALSLPTENRADIDGLSQPLPAVADKDGNLVAAWETTKFFGYADPPHGWQMQHDNYNGGKNDGFVTSFQRYFQDHPDEPGDKDPATPMSYYTRASLPVLYSLADRFTVCDRWFSSLLSSTWPNRKYLYSGRRDDDRDTQAVPPFPGFNTLPFPSAVEDARDPDTGDRLTWKCYFSDLPFLAFWYKFAAFHALHNFVSVAEFVNDCREDRLPTISFIDPPFSLADDHPSHDIRLGQKFLGLIVDALTHSESWNSSALVLLYDENGAFYDHVPPPSGFGGQDPEPEPDTPLGFRIPAVVISPYALRGRGCRTVFDHTVLMKSIAVRWNVEFDPGAFGSRWTRAPEIWSSCFDFTQAPLDMGTYTHAPGAPAPFQDLPWSIGVDELLATPAGGLESLIERIFVLPALKALDRRAQIFDALSNLERGVANLKQMTPPSS